ncbi:unnamed protein product [Owenia fusiformis]|uniref:Coiled-coil domain-containing protein 57-like n=1 Tax=Owenia fusiformis TaxID=6347 RepID=A0A8S4PMW0_OWEFU|nr:unnamed protein product [Owenia fusiformis]
METAISEEDLKKLTEQKEKEWRELQELRSSTLESAYKEKEKKLNEEREKFQKLKEDFKYNLRLLQERDAELEKYDASFSALKTQVNAKNAALSDVHMQVDDLKIALRREVDEKNALNVHYQQRLGERQTEVEQFKRLKDSELSTQKQTSDSERRQLQQKVLELEEELQMQKHDLTTGYEESLIKKEKECQEKLDAVNTSALSSDLKVKLLTKELDMLKRTNLKQIDEFNDIEDGQRQLAKLLKEKEWECADIKAMKDARISDLEEGIKQTELTTKRLQEDFKRKHEELDRYAREKENALHNLKDSYNNREKDLEDTIRQLQGQLEDFGIKMRQMEWTKEDIMKDKEITIERLKDELGELKLKWDGQIAAMSKDNVARDVENEHLKDSNDKLTNELHQRKLDLERYQKELNLAVERQRDLERSKAQLDLDWQERYDDVERSQYEKSEDLIKSLTDARDEALATIKEIKRELAQKVDLIKALTVDKNQAFATLKQHGINIDRKHETGSVPQEIKVLQQQNDNLRAVVHQMRQQMEYLGTHAPRDTNNTKSSDYTDALEKEVKNLKIKIRQLEQKPFETASEEKTPPSNDDMKNLVGDNVIVKAHVQALNDTIGSLRSDKTELSAQLKKHQARNLYLESMVESLSKQPREKQVEVDQLQYELGAQGRRNQAEIASLRQRIGELELQLVETRKEADEYFKGSLERNMENTALGNQVSSLKMDLANKLPSVNYGAQELMIQQLQDEITRQRSQIMGQKQANMTYIPEKDKSAVQQLQLKLGAAVKQIGQLAREKQQLTELGNRLRAQLNKAGVSLPSPPKPKPSAPAIQPWSTGGDVNINQAVKNRLKQLEKMQYDVTRQQLALAQKQKVSPRRDVQEREPPSLETKPPKVEAEPSRLEELSSSTSEDVEPRPPSILKRPSSAPQGPYNQPVQFDIPSSAERGPVTTPSDHSSLGSRDIDPTLFTTMSSMGGGESLQDIWRMLDEGQTPSLFGAGDTVSPIPMANRSESVQSNTQPSLPYTHSGPTDTQSGRGPTDTQSGPYIQPSRSQDTMQTNRGITDNNQWTLKGQKQDLSSKQTNKKELSSKAAGRVTSQKYTPKHKIRNYNERDDR